jgi:hypothetical protein
MRELKLQLFWNECAECGLRFDTLVLSGDYGAFLYDNGKGVLQYLDPYDDAVWGEAKALMEQELGSRIDDTDRAAVFHRLLAETIDPPEGGVPFSSAWEKPPCPRCGSRKRKGYGPIEPPRFQTVEVPAVSHARWSSLGPDEKLAIVRRVLS